MTERGLHRARPVRAAPPAPPGRRGARARRSRRCGRSGRRRAPARPGRRQLGPGEPVDRQLQRVGGLRAVGLPVHDQVAAVAARRTPRRCGRAPPARRAPARTAARRRAGTRSANGPASKRRDQLAQVVLVVDADVAAARAGRRGRAATAGRTGPRPRRGTGCRTGPRATAGAASAGPASRANCVRVVAQPRQRRWRTGWRAAGPRPARPGRPAPRPAAARARRPTPSTRSTPRPGRARRRRRTSASAIAVAHQLGRHQPALVLGRAHRPPATAPTSAARVQRVGRRRPPASSGHCSGCSPQLLERVAAPSRWYGEGRSGFLRVGLHR